MKNYLYGNDVLKVNKRLYLALGQVNAVVYEQTCAEVKSNQDNKRDAFRDGRWWMYFSLPKLVKRDYPYLGTDAVGNAYRALTEKGFIERGNYNRLRKDRTCWYSPNLEVREQFLQSLDTHEHICDIPGEEYFFLQKDLIRAFGFSAGVILRTIAYWLRANEQSEVGSDDENVSITNADDVIYTQLNKKTFTQKRVECGQKIPLRLGKSNTFRYLMQRPFSVLLSSLKSLELLVLVSSSYARETPASRTRSTPKFLLSLWKPGLQRIHRAAWDAKKQRQRTAKLNANTTILLTNGNYRVRVVTLRHIVRNNPFGQRTKMTTWTTNHDHYKRILLYKRKIRILCFVEIQRNERPNFSEFDVRKNLGKTPQNHSVSFTSKEEAAQTSDPVFSLTSKTESFAPAAPRKPKRRTDHSPVQAKQIYQPSEWRQWILAVLRPFDLEEFIDCSEEDFPDIGRYRRAAKMMRAMAQSYNTHFPSAYQITHKDVGLMYDELSVDWEYSILEQLSPQGLANHFTAYMMKTHTREELKANRGQ